MCVGRSGEGLVPSGGLQPPLPGSQPGGLVQLAYEGMVLTGASLSWGCYRRTPRPPARVGSESRRSRALPLRRCAFRGPTSPLPHAASWSPNTGSNRARPGTGRPPRRRGWGRESGADPRCRTEPSWASTRRFHRVSLIGSVELLLGIEPRPPGYGPGAPPSTLQQQ